MNLSKEEIKEIAQQGYADPGFFCKFFLPHWFTDELQWVHLGLLAILTRKCEFLKNYPAALQKIIENFTWTDGQVERGIFDFSAGHVSMHLGRFTEIMIPRGFGKTTVVNAATLYAILYKDYKFPVYISESGPHSKMQLGNVRRELDSNERIKLVFGEQKPEQRQGLRWSEDMVETLAGAVVLSRGRGAQIRGLNHNGQRPDWIVLDDVEDNESVLTEDQRAKVRHWFYADVKPALPELDPHATIVAIGTLLHNEALLVTLQRDPEWSCVILGATDKSGELLWPNLIPQAKLDTIKQSYQLAGELSTYYMEYHNTIRADETAKFKSQYIIYGMAEKQLHKAMSVDPAISNEPGASFCAFGVVGMEETGLIHVLDVEGAVGMTPREQVDLYFELSFRWDPQHHGVEGIAYQKALIHLLREEMFRKGKYFEIEDIKHTSRDVKGLNKDRRILGVLQPRYAGGYVRHRMRFPVYETQLLDFPNGKKDFPDVIAQAISLLDPYAAQAADPDLDLGADEYEPLEDVLANWRAV